MKTGFAFSEHIKTEKLSRRRFSDSLYRPMRNRFLLLVGVIAVLFLSTRLLYVQLVKGSYYRGLSDANRTRTNLIHAPRGIIFDRNGQPLVYNIPGFKEVTKDKSIVISKEKALSLLSKNARNVEIDSLRQYPLKEAEAHVIGYIGQIGVEELKDPVFSDYSHNDWVGKSGIEQEYEQILKGTSGKQLIEVDAMGKQVRVLGQTDPVPGQDITLTLDSKLQEAVYKAMDGVKKGSVIVSTPTGEILAMVSKPSFDPNLFTLGEDYHENGGEYANVASVLGDNQSQPLLDRGIAGTYPPGSTFKLITAAAGLEDHTIDEQYSIDDTGILRVGDFSFSNWFFSQYGRTDGKVDVVKGIARSNDIFFYKLAEKVGVDKLSSMGKEFGLGTRLGLDLEGEASGVLPTKEWKQKIIGEPWYLGDTYHYGIGQGFLLTTPLQVNSWTATIANGGMVYRPYLLQSAKSKALRAKFLSDKTVSLIRQGMIQACSPGGVAWPLFEFRVKNKELSIDEKNIIEAPQATTSADFKDYRHVVIACKTGTAQHGGETTLPHAWITLFAPAYNPKIVVTVLSEESGEGSNIAAPVAKKVLEAWFSSTR